jgi:photosystem II stability/assembly factor-like uncharacterized protein
MKMRRRWLSALSLGLTLALAPPHAPVSAADLDPGLLAGMKARSIGPATMSGRIAAVESSAANPDLIYVGTATGGVWKSVNGGLTFDPVFDDQPVHAIGAVALDPANPDVVWVGTGEGNPRNSVSIGEGLFKSLDGGKTWRRMGLEKTERIHRIALDPRDPDTAYVAAMGRLWGENPERGVFKTTDGGRTWKRVLYVDERTGAADLVMDPENPNKLFAAMWEFRRWPWNFRSGGPGSGLYVSHDGGESWRRLTEDDGLPGGELGRIGLAIAPSDPRVVYALTEAKRTALARSEDGGRTWKLVNTRNDVSPRPFYYADIRVDPKDPNRVYRLATNLEVSEDGGRTFRTLGGFGRIHPDHHAMWIHPENPRRILNGNDGGVYISDDRGESWRFVANLPLAQFYHVRVDDAVPYNVYGGLQDNGSWKGPSNVWENAGIRNHHWQEVGFGDGFDTVPDPRDPMRGYAMSQAGFLSRWDLRTGERKDIRPSPPDRKTRLRFNWNAAIAIDPFEPDTIYYGSQFVHKSTDRGDTWATISPDLTTNKPEWQKQSESGGLTLDVTGAENFTTIVSLALSPAQRGVLWAGTDDGRLHVSRDGGANWQSVEGNLRGVPANTWIPHIAPSPHDAGTAFAVFDDHRRSNFTPYVQKTTDYGRTWKSLATPNLRGYALSIVQDPVDPDLLFLGTELGLWMSNDGGGSWMPWRHGVPTASVMDLLIHSRDHDLVVATHGRSLYVLDDIGPLREVSEETQKKPLHLFKVADTIQARVAQTGSSRFPGHGEFRGATRPPGAMITYSLNVPGLPHPDKEKERERKESERAATAAQPAGEQGGRPLVKAPGEGEEPAEEGAGGPRKGPEAKIEILDGSGKVIRTLRQPATRGINRATWDLRHEPFRRMPRPGEEENEFRRARGPEAVPGTYTARVTYGDHKAETPVRVVADPRTKADPQDRPAIFQALRRAGAVQETLTTAIERIQKTRSDVDAITAKLRKDDEDAKRAGSPEDPARKELLASARTLKQGLDRLEKRLWNNPETARGITEDTDLESKVGYVSRAISSSWDTPTPAHLAYLTQAEELAAEVFADVNRFFAEDVAAFRAKVQGAGVQLLPDWGSLEVPGSTR